MFNDPQIRKAFIPILNIYYWFRYKKELRELVGTRYNAFFLIEMALCMVLLAIFGYSIGAIYTVVDIKLYFWILIIICCGYICLTVLVIIRTLLYRRELRIAIEKYLVYYDNGVYYKSQELTKTNEINGDGGEEKP